MFASLHIMVALYILLWLGARNHTTLKPLLPEWPESVIERDVIPTIFFPLAFLAFTSAPFGHLYSRNSMEERELKDEKYEASTCTRRP